MKKYSMQNTKICLILLKRDLTVLLWSKEPIFLDCCTYMTREEYILTLIIQLIIPVLRSLFKVTKKPSILDMNRSFLRMQVIILFTLLILKTLNSKKLSRRYINVRVVQDLILPVHIFSTESKYHSKIWVLVSLMAMKALGGGGKIKNCRVHNKLRRMQIKWLNRKHWNKNRLRLRNVQQRQKL